MLENTMRRQLFNYLREKYENDQGNNDFLFLID
jgi:hypothetical protein